MYTRIQGYKNTGVQEYRDTRIQGDTGIQGYRDTRIQGYKDTGILGYRDTRIQGYKDTGIQGYRDTRIQGYRNTGIQKYRGTGVKRYQNTGLQGYRGTVVHPTHSRSDTLTFLMKCVSDLQATVHHTTKYRRTDLTLGGCNPVRNLTHLIFLVT